MASQLWDVWFVARNVRSRQQAMHVEQGIPGWPRKGVTQRPSPPSVQRPSPPLSRCIAAHHIVLLLAPALTVGAVYLGRV